MKTRTIVRTMPLKYRYGDEPDLFELCIDESEGCGLSHEHDYGHDFPMERAELQELRDQIDRTLNATAVDVRGERDCGAK